MALSPTPKPGSRPFKQLYQKLGQVLDAPTLVVLLFGALDRKRLETTYSRFAPRQGPRAQVLDKEELVGAVAGWFFSSLEVAHALVRDLDRAARKERHIVASLPNAQVEQRLKSYQALDFQRERAKLMWALLRDGRDEAWRHAQHLAAEMVTDAQGGDEVVAVPHGDEDSRLDALRQRLMSFENAAREADGQRKGLQSQLVRTERERADLMVAVGRKENALRAEEQARREAERQLSQMQKRQAELEQQLASIHPDELKRLQDERDRLSRRLRRVEKKLNAEEVESLRAQNQRLHERVEELEQAQRQQREQRQQLLQSLTVRDRATQDRLSKLRGALKTARRLAQNPADGTPRERPHSDEERVGIFVDAANISASARRASGETFDFSKLLDLAGERPTLLRMAYVVDNGQTGFERFAQALRDLGFTVKVKKPSRRPDGSVKADWDMAIAMDVIDARHRVDTVLIASGDGDFVPLVRRLKRWRMRVEVAAYPHACHPELRRCADSFWILGETSP